MNSFRLLTVGVPLLFTLTSVGVAASDVESSKLSPGVVTQGAGFQSPKSSAGVVLQGDSFQSSRISTGVVLESATFRSSKLSVGIVVLALPGGGLVSRAPLTHW